MILFKSKRLVNRMFHSILDLFFFLSEVCTSSRYSASKYAFLFHHLFFVRLRMKDRRTPASAACIAKIL